MTASEQAITFDCAGETLVGILHRPAQPARIGLVIVPGAPQYRVGSHRQFVLLARDLAAQGIPVLRFDYRGMGDSDGAFRSFEAVSEDIGTAIGELTSRVPEVEEIFLWGLCDGASAIGFHAAKDARVTGIALVNPWVRDRDTVDQAHVRHYYRDRLRSADLWKRLFSGQVELGKAFGDLVATLGRLARRKAAGLSPEAMESQPLCARVSTALQAYNGRVLLILSGADLTAQEFDASVLETDAAATWLSRIDSTLVRLEGVNHTYSRAVWRRQVHQATLDWLRADS